ncbi:hypothetical protein M431DRAFT_511901 [Trichoderma harzianum CBS 226.95]|uniref:Uncharacterized protein n=1 Tax=Trichoderma harzianum CBS 226.95 TaxID=983964 RepID=A0A2T3ZZU5_TRIHA|nr:hypothetical protein M431DRAFT_511901 [Trichoderma harzianum CBS 226.95]PTB50330.1 hypothetical protein M431DRAFT_511901 [Trichoderma harzianum CBS 226.95]
MDLLTNEAAGLKIGHGWGHVSQVELLVMDSRILAFCKIRKAKKKAECYHLTRHGFNEMDTRYELRLHAVLFFKNAQLWSLLFSSINSPILFASPAIAAISLFVWDLEPN